MSGHTVLSFTPYDKDNSPPKAKHQIVMKARTVRNGMCASTRGSDGLTGLRRFFSTTLSVA